MLSAEIQHLLGLGDTADGRTTQAAPHTEQREHRHHHRVLRCAEFDEHTVEIQQSEVPAQIQIGRDSVEDDVEGVAQILERVAVAGGVVGLGAQAKSVLHLLQRLRQHRHLGAHCRGQFDSQMSQSAQTDDPDPGARSDLPVPQRRIGGDPGAQQRRRGIQGQRGGNGEDVVLVDHDAAAVATVGRCAVLADSVVGADVAAAGAVLLDTRLAVLALAAGIDEAADTHAVADAEFTDLRTDLGDDAGDLMAGHHRVTGLTPLGAHGVDIGVADPGEVDVESHVVGPDIAAGDRGLGQWFGGRSCGICVNGAHDRQD